MNDDKTKAAAASDAKAMAAKNDLANITAKPTESMQDLVEEFEENQDDFQAMYNAGGNFKQKLERIAGGFHKGGTEHEPVPRVKERVIESVEEIPITPELENKPELIGYIEKVEKEAELPKSIVDDYTQQVLLKSADPQNVKITLPMTLDEAQTDLKKSIWDSVRWLAVWCIRQFKTLKGRAEYKQ